MYVITNNGVGELSKYKNKDVCEIVGINEVTLIKLKKHREPIRKVTAYCITKFLNSEAEIEEYFERVGN